MAWNIDVCDDEAEICSQIAGYLNRIQEEKHESFRVRVFSSAEELLAAGQTGTDIILLDISMGGMTGMEAARTLRANGCKAAIVFITTMTQYAIEGYEVHAFGFLKKPISYPIFEHQLTDLLVHLRRARGTKWEVSSAEGIVVLPTNNILFVESYGHNINAKLKSGRVLACYTTLSKAESDLEKNGFFRCHKSFLINLLHVQKIGQDEVLMSGGVTVPLSRHRRTEFLSAFARFREGLL